MQLAKGTVILSPENHQIKEVTPAEAMILAKLHYQYSNGSPLGDFFIQPGEALTIEQEGKPAEEAYFNQNAGKHIEARAEIPAKTHKRTQGEEIQRLKRKYTGNITVDGVAKPAFEATFGAGLVRLPEKFEEITEFVGEHFFAAEEHAAFSEDKKRATELAKKSRPELTDAALALKIKVHHTDSKDYVIAAIINAENKAKTEKTEAPAA